MASKKHRQALKKWYAKYRPNNRKTTTVRRKPKGPRQRMDKQQYQNHKLYNQRTTINLRGPRGIIKQESDIGGLW